MKFRPEHMMLVHLPHKWRKYVGPIYEDFLMESRFSPLLDQMVLVAAYVKTDVRVLYDRRPMQVIAINRPSTANWEDHIVYSIARYPSAVPGATNVTSGYSRHGLVLKRRKYSR